ncbi:MULTISPECIES: hypothetical protein [unclassified Exiguobacterium]|uniref:hypothetical protein n=1 Tax=unclassified Exiguobacterium TaxID=2644629 RepID=UPI001BEB060A|nr:MULTISPECIES: hypothetical protein [unclassified Exiguobacterium]
MTQFESRNGRTITEGQRVKVYRNLHNGKFSIQDAKTGLVLGYSDKVKLTDVKFKVNEAGRRRVIQEQRKNVHAFLVGNFAGHDTEERSEPIYYNPYKVSKFTKPDGNAIEEAGQAVLDEGRIYA